MTDTASTPLAPRYFSTYSGVKLPFRLTAELQAHEIENRNTYFRGHFDADGRLHSFEKLVYDEIELAHHYRYDANGVLLEADITDADGDTQTLHFPPA